MKAEEYLETRRCNSAISNKFDMCYMDAAYNAIEMARQEEREKAMDSFDEVLSDMTYHISRGEDYGNVYRKFNELLNK
jgi:hypothetical protein